MWINRIDTLSKSKPIPAGFIDDKRSVYCDNRKLKDWTSGDLNTKFALSERLEQLVQPKPRHKEWMGDRPTPIWLVSQGAKSANASGRVQSLAEPKRHHRDFEPSKPVYSIVSNAAKSASANERIETLAKAKSYQELPIKPDSCWDYSEWNSDVSKAALKHNATDRTQQLSNPKSLHRTYKESRPVIWQVPHAARKALPSIRVQQLSRPKSRSQYKEDYDSTCWKVSTSAKNARPSPRIEELSAPIPRKIKQKRGGAAPKN
ncbi:sperm microtubule associated protein 2-like isoform X1 [Clytia hemisphaerica]|uniref:sperm microtubule associated protein 2-like isoform X1 n=1 Tax=Clytia hemisphaerica TaxID=252671 RepID=UPI0034D49DA4